MEKAVINTIVDELVRRLARELDSESDKPSGSSTPAITPQVARGPAMIRRRLGLFDDLDGATRAAQQAYEAFAALPLEIHRRVIDAMRATSRRLAEEISQRAVSETGLGNVPDKIKKNLLCAEKTPGMELLEPKAVTGDHGLMLLERAPFGVIGAITPSTNATETVINNGIAMVAGGNAVVFNVHPSAKGVCRFLVEQLNEAIVSAGGPPELLCAMADPTIESAQALMRHPGVRLLVVTGGPAVVKAAMSSGKRAIAAGPGNPPTVVDETAHLEHAARDIVDGASLDNNIVCIVEKEILAVASVADQLKRELGRHGAWEVPQRHVARLEALLVDQGHPAREWVGKDARQIAQAAGLEPPEGTRLLFAEVDPSHPFVQLELLMPVVGFSRLPTVEACIAAAVQAEHGFGHTATMHSTNIDHLSLMAKRMNTSIFVKNGPSFAGLGLGGEGYTSFTIASPTGEGLTTPVSFTRERRCTLKDAFRIV